MFPGSREDGSGCQSRDWRSGAMSGIFSAGKSLWVVVGLVYTFFLREPDLSVLLTNLGYFELRVRARDGVSQVHPFLTCKNLT